MVLSDSNREALIIRWRRLLILGLVDFFNGTNEFGKLIVKEMLDLYEGVMKAFAESLGISLREDNKWKDFWIVFRDVQNNSKPDAGVKAKLKLINDVVYSREFNSLRKLRNDETHNLNLPDFPKETVIRVWRLLYDEVSIIDSDLFECAKGRPEFEDFYWFQHFFKIVILDGNKVRLDLDTIKKKRETFPYLSVERQSKTAHIELEMDIWELINSIKKGFAEKDLNVVV